VIEESDETGRRGTIRDVAGIFPANSQVLNGNGPAAAATRERTWEVITQLGYKRTHLAAPHNQQVLSLCGGLPCHGGRDHEPDRRHTEGERTLV
jgi:hypothetical protein